MKASATAALPSFCYMPELPEVETIRRSLLSHVGAVIVDVDVRERRLRRPLAENFREKLLDRRIEAIERHGKYLLLALDAGGALLAHMGMSGSIERRPLDGRPAPHDHVRFLLDEGIALVFNDPRRFGVLCAGSRSDLVELLPTGRDPLLRPCSAGELQSIARGRRLPIKTLLMDQRAIAGIGNIYANEILFVAGIRPRRRAARLTRRELEQLADAMHSVLEHAVRLGGSSISDYRDADGRTGFFQMQHAVYDRNGKPCRQCRTPIRRVVQSGRSSFYCPTCQR